ncbi:MAG: Uma2 family endonuclease [Verrucomicrobiales bacterium]
MGGRFCHDSKACRTALFSLAEYCERERAADSKSEFFQGEIFAMAGGTINHSRISGRVYAALQQRLEGRRCEAFNSDLMVVIPAASLGTYPDVSVVCGDLQTDAETPNAVTNPTTIVEVLSDSTETWDRGKKFQSYMKLESLREYILVSQKEPRVEWFHRKDNGDWAIGMVEGIGSDFTFPELGSPSRWRKSMRAWNLRGAASAVMRLGSGGQIARRARILFAEKACHFCRNR